MKKYTVLFISLFISFIALSQNIPEKQNPPRLVNDFADILTDSEEQQLEAKLVAFDNETSVQIVIVTVNSLDGQDKAMYAYTLGEEWKVGQEKFDNGIVVLVKPKTSDSKGEAFIATGYGVEPLIPDATAKEIVENEMIPNFKNNDIYLGIESATNTLISLTKKEFSSDEYKMKSSSNTKTTAIIIFIIIVIIASMLFKNRGGGRMGGIGTGAVFFGGTGGFSSFSSGGGSFGGFGGGSFGGGGAGGSW
ncbi:MAG TPA: hypothetical protein DDX39_05700 [Bacteroidales bacterium]|nr:MAG: hypothetical protein A2W98_06970 [Bacteroidetes bacterium GWF2_33_38]HBF88118.1 hypothetical protein [Bacteroidales bacterium]